MEQTSDHFLAAEFLLDLTNADFAADKEATAKDLYKVHTAWDAHHSPEPMRQDPQGEDTYDVVAPKGQGFEKSLSIPFILLHRLLIKSFRDVVAYGIRFAMYIGKYAQIQRSVIGALIVSRTCYHDGHSLASVTYYS